MSRKKTLEEFIVEANSIHNNKYSYTEYIDANTKIKIVCPIHGVFEQTPNKHLKGQGCPKCAEIKREEHRKHIDSKKFIEDAVKVHGNLYDYSLVKDCNNNHTKVKIICKKHGVFEQDYTHHVGRKHGCPSCGNDKSHSCRVKLVKMYEEHASKQHGNKYTYHGDYSLSKNKILITCPIHGDFTQEAESHLQGHGCPYCGKEISKQENEIYDFFKKYLKNNDIVKHDKTILNGKEIDIFVPSLNLGVEYNGVRWHSEKFGRDKYYHLKKLEDCASKGIRLVQIFEDEYLTKKDIVKDKLLRIFGISDWLTKMSARKCYIKEIGNDLSKKFLEKNHIQGFVNSTLYFGCFYESKLIGVMTFTEESKGKWNLTRFATDNRYICRGVGGKLFSYFIKHFKPVEVKSFADRRWTVDNDNNLYTKLGFKLDKILEPDYRYIKDNNRIHKFNFRKQRLHKKYGFPLSMTESEMAAKLGYYKIWDCGLFKYIWKNPDIYIEK